MIETVVRVLNGEEVLPSTTTPTRKKARTPEAGGTCIRCGAAIAFNPERPYCRTCYREWRADSGGEPVRESHCHRCGKQHRTTIHKPLCYACFKRG